MRNAGVCAAILATMIGACGGSPGTTIGGSNGGSSGGGGSGGGSNGGGGSGGASGGGSNGGGSGDEGGSSDDGGSSSGGSSLFDGADWECAESVVLGGYSATCVSCIQMMCGSQLAMCANSSCTTCEDPVFNCEGQKCSSDCGGGGSSSGTMTGEGGTASGGSCAGLMTCCSLIASVDPTEAASCTTIAENNDQSSCQAVLAMLPSELVSACQ
ncbi:MAG: hypothetical protein ACLP1X_17310 [Polyangiaceae bacterium]|jgi:hypothetical protein